MNKAVIPSVFLFSLLIASPATVFGGLSSATVILGPNGESPDIPIEMIQMTLTSSSPVPIPLASDPGNVLGDSVDGYGFVNSQIDISLSPTTLSLGEIKLTLPGASGTTLVTDGDTFQVDSFFDVYYDITITDLDDRPERDFAGLSDGEAFSFPDVGPVRLQASYSCEAQVVKTVMGCLPELQDELLTSLLTSTIEIPLGIDINGNGEDDKIKLTSHQLDSGMFIDEDFIPDFGYQVDFEDSVLNLEGVVVDESSDPPFSDILVIGESVVIFVPVPGALPPLPGFEPEIIGGEILSIETTSLLLTGIHSQSWMIPIILSIIGVTVVLVTRK